MEELKGALPFSIQGNREELPVELPNGMPNGAKAPVAEVYLPPEKVNV